MATMPTIKGVELQILIGDGESPEEFVHPCMINAERGVNWETGGEDEDIPDCDDPTGLAWNEHTGTTRKGTISGAGKLHADKESISMFIDWNWNDEPKNVKILYGETGVMIEGAWKLTQFNTSGARGTVAQATLTLISHGEQVKTVTP